MNVRELIEQLEKLTGDLEVHCAANGYDSTNCPLVEEVKLETVVFFSGEYHPVRYFPPENIKDDPQHEVVLLG